MEAMHHALTELNARVTKRQGGHIQAVVRGASYYNDESESETQKQCVFYPPYFVDVRLVTYKSDNCERMLLLRVYHHATDSGADDDDDDDDEGVTTSGGGRSVRFGVAFLQQINHRFFQRGGDGNFSERRRLRFESF